MFVTTDPGRLFCCRRCALGWALTGRPAIVLSADEATERAVKREAV